MTKSNKNKYFALKMDGYSAYNISRRFGSKEGREHYQKRLDSILQDLIKNSQKYSDRQIVDKLFSYFYIKTQLLEYLLKD